MLRPVAFATALALVAAIMHLLFALTALLSPSLFRLLFNAQFFGADVASLLPRVIPYDGFVVTFVVLVISAWVIGYAWAWLYNRLTAIF
ncbi:MAG: DUF5676 family membrane protein [Candidatus Rokuibacteriota bacterium]